MTAARETRLPGSWWLAAVVVLAAGLRAAPWVKPHVFTGVMEYDDGVYYAASRALLHGLVPYRDFTVVHPPLTSVLLLPAALVGAAVGDPAGMAVARIEVLLAACVNVWLVFRLTQAAVASSGVDGLRRLPPYVAAGLYAVAPGAVAAAHTALLEPVTTLFGLLAMVWLSRRPLTTHRAVLGGVCLAAALGVKLFAGVYVVVAAGWLLVTARERFLAAALGFLGTLAAVFGPVLALAGPTVVWRDLVATQLTRPADGGVSALSRVRSVFGVGATPTAVGLGVVALCLLGCIAVLIEGRRRLPAQFWAWVAIAVLSAAAFVSSPSYFDHYAEFFAAPFAVAVGMAFATMTLSTMRLRHGVVVAAVTALVVVALLGSVRADSRWQRSPSVQAGTRDVPRSACVYADAVSLLIAADRFRVPDRRCPGWLDGRGQNLVWSVGRHHVDEFYPRGFLLDRRWQVQTLRQVEAASYLLVRSDPRQIPEWGEDIRMYVAGHFREVWSDSGRIPAQLWMRTSCSSHGGSSGLKGRAP